MSSDNTEKPKVWKIMRTILFNIIGNVVFWAGVIWTGMLFMQLNIYRAIR